ncbi:MAG: short-chain dehydrogenase [Deltaproteobacteria bacterium]|nr:SDR family oxidoreductase [Deltaproteobacteria bacterium]RLB50868.1 MAG: short-chain dehydrogenase [Deltaproteobacteria bacterium]
MTDLQDKRVLITGGAQGIGLEMALKFAGRGAEIVIADLNEAKLGEATAKIEAAGAAAWGFPVDVTDPASIAALRAKIAAEAGPIDVLVNNAGVVFGGPFIETPLERHFKTYEVNVLGVVAMTHAFLSDLIDRPESHIVHISSASGLVGLPFGSTYASSKWAVIGFSESIRAELRLLGHKHVHSTVVCPSYIGTGMFEGAEAPKATSILDPTHLAEKVVRGVERNRVQVLEPWMVKITPLLRELLPTAIYDKVAHLFGADTSMAQWTGHGGSAKPEAQAQPESRDQADAERQ